jgi:Putative zinc-finger
MTCAEVRQRLDDYVDGELPSGELHEVELHLAACPACSGEERAIRALLAHAAALPRRASPSRDLWPEIAAEIGAGKGARVLGFPARPAALGGLLAAAAALFVALVIRSGPSPESTPAGTSSGSPAPTLAAASPGLELQGAEADYERAARALLATLEARRDELGPETLRNVEQNMAVIDQALREVRAALDAEPGNPELTRMLAATHRKKVDVLRQVVKLSTSRL